MKDLVNDQLIGLWKSQDMLPNWNYSDGVEIIIYSYNSFSIRIEGAHTLLAEGKMELHNLNDDAFELIIDGSGIDEKYMRLQGRMYMATPSSVPPSFVLSVPEYGERFFIKTRD